MVLVLDEIEKPGTWVRFYGPPRLWCLEHSPLGTGFGFLQPQRRPFFPGPDGSFASECRDQRRSECLARTGRAPDRRDELKSSKPYWDLQLSGGTAFVLGSEREGLGEFWKERIGEWARIPMEGEASSLNLNASAACLLAEFNRTVA